jgi:hypothetical protein
MFKWVAGVAGLLTIIAMIWGGICGFDSRYAKAQDHQALKQTVQDKLDNDHLRLLRERKWQMEKEFPKPEARTPSVATQIKNYELQEKFFEQRLGPREMPQ